MRFKYAFVSMLVCLTAAFPVAAPAANYGNATISVLQGFYDGADCFFFELQGVSVADPVYPGSPWFAINRSQFGAKDAFAMLLASKLAGSTVHVWTSGQLTCGYAGVANINVE
jgi:hypothetical protein